MSKRTESGGMPTRADDEPLPKKRKARKLERPRVLSTNVIACGDGSLVVEVVRANSLTRHYLEVAAVQALTRYFL